VNVRAIAQGCSEYNITVVVDGDEQRQGPARGALPILPLQHAPGRGPHWAGADWGHAPPAIKEQVRCCY